MLAELISTKSTEIKLHVLVQELATYTLWAKSGPWHILYGSQAKIVFALKKIIQVKEEEEGGEEATETI